MFRKFTNGCVHLVNRFLPDPFIFCISLTVVVFSAAIPATGALPFGGGTASAFFNKLTLMANVSMTLPYLFLALAFPFFKARQDLDRPFVIFKTHLSAMIATVVVVLVVTFANVFTIIQPVVEAGDWDSTLWMIGGPVFFSLLAMAIYQNYCSRMANKPELALD